MSLLDQYQAQLQRERKAASRDQRALASLSEAIARKQRERDRAKTPIRQRTLQGEVERLHDQRAKAEKALVVRQRRVVELESKISTEQRRLEERTTRRQQQGTRKQDQSHRSLESSVATTSSTVSDLQARVAELEQALLERVHAVVSADPVSRAHDVFLSHAGPDKEVAGELYTELTARGLDVWFDGAELRLGESLTRQIDRGIARCRIGVILVTAAFVQGRSWTEREMGALMASNRRIIPVLDGVTFDDLGQYSPLLIDLVGLTTETEGLGDIAERIKATLTSTDCAPS